MEIFVVSCNPTDHSGVFVVWRQVACRVTVMADRYPLVTAPSLGVAYPSMDDPGTAETWFQRMLAEAEKYGSIRKTAFRQMQP